MYAVYHGPTGIKNIANHVNGLACALGSGLKKMNFELGSESFFDTVWIKGIDAKKIKTLAEKHELNFYIKNENEVTISFSEPHTAEDVSLILELFSQLDEEKGKSEAEKLTLNDQLKRNEDALTQPIFNQIAI